MSKAEKLRHCTVFRCEDFYRVPNYCMRKGGVQQNVSEGQLCSLGYPQIPEETSENDSQLVQSVQQAPWMRTDNGEVSPAPAQMGIKNLKKFKILFHN